jgi:hypothetical protein
MKYFFNKPLYSDIKLIVNGTAIYAHKAILNTRCAVLATMLSSGFLEATSDSIEIGDTTTESFLAFLGKFDFR